MNNLAKQQCKPFKKGIKPLSASVTKALLDRLHSEWEINEHHKCLTRSLSFKDFYETIAFVNAVAWIARQQNHYPKLKIDEIECHIEYSTASAEGLTLNDFICAAKIDLILEQTLSVHIPTQKHHTNDKSPPESQPNNPARVTNKTRKPAMGKHTSRYDQQTLVITRPVSKTEFEENDMPHGYNPDIALNEKTEQQTQIMTRPIFKDHIPEIAEDPENQMTETHFQNTVNIEAESHRTNREIAVENAFSGPESLFERTLVLEKPYTMAEISPTATGTNTNDTENEIPSLPDPDEVPTAVYNPETDDIRRPPNLEIDDKPEHDSADNDAGEATIPEGTLADMEKTLVLSTAKQKNMPMHAQNDEQTVVLTAPFNSNDENFLEKTGPKSKDNTTTVDPAIENDDTLVMHTNTYTPVRE